MNPTRASSAATRAAARRRPIGVYWGRFNPPHVGHLGVIRRFQDRYRLIVVVGSAEHHDERMNPFRGSERQKMMQAYLRESGIRGVRVVTLEDGDSESRAVATLVRTFRPEVVLRSTEKRGRLDAALAKAGVRVVRFGRRGTVSSTRIRHAIATGDPRWTALTGTSVVRLIRQFHGIERIRESHRTGRAVVGG